MRLSKTVAVILFRFSSLSFVPKAKASLKSGVHSAAKVNSVSKNSLSKAAAKAKHKKSKINFFFPEILRKSFQLDKEKSSKETKFEVSGNASMASVR